MPDVLVAPSARDLTRTYMMTQLTARGIIIDSWTSGIPAARPARFATIEDLNSATEHGPFADSQMIQIRVYDKDLKFVRDTMRLIKGLWKAMPSERIVQNVEHAGGPSDDTDDDVPGLHYGQIIAWVTVMCVPA